MELKARTGLLGYGSASSSGATCGTGTPHTVEVFLVKNFSNSLLYSLSMYVDCEVTSAKHHIQFSCTTSMELKAFLIRTGFLAKICSASSSIDEEERDWQPTMNITETNAL